jgi:hypothetical protein
MPEEFLGHLSFDKRYPSESFPPQDCSDAWLKFADVWEEEGITFRTDLWIQYRDSKKTISVSGQLSRASSSPNKVASQARSSRIKTTAPRTSLVLDTSLYHSSGEIPDTDKYGSQRSGRGRALQVS